MNWLLPLNQHLRNVYVSRSRIRIDTIVRSSSDLKKTGYALCKFYCEWQKSFNDDEVGDC